MTPKQIKAAKLLNEEIQRMQGRAELTSECFQSHQSSLFSLLAQDAAVELVEENRDKATFYYESYLDLTIHIAKLTRKLAELTKK